MALSRAIAMPRKRPHAPRAVGCGAGFELAAATSKAQMEGANYTPPRTRSCTGRGAPGVAPGRGRVVIDEKKAPEMAMLIRCQLMANTGEQLR